MFMSQKKRDKVAILTVLKHCGGSATYSDIKLRAGELVADALIELVTEGKVLRDEDEARPFGRRVLFKLPETVPPVLIPIPPVHGSHSRDSHSRES
jgi:hypothetical protein